MAIPDVERDTQARRPRSHRIEFRLLMWLGAIALLTLTGFETIEVAHDRRTLASAGADRALIAVARRDSVWFHAVHAAATIAALGIGVHLLTRRLISGRAARMLESIHVFRLGTWSLPSDEAPADELSSVVEALRRLGPHLEQKLSTFVACDRKATVARLGIAYESSLAPSARRIVALAREGRARQPGEPGWDGIEQSALHILADMGQLGRPEHPAVAPIVAGASPVRLRRDQPHGRQTRPQGPSVARRSP